ACSCQSRKVPYANSLVSCHSGFFIKHKRELTTLPVLRYSSRHKKGGLKILSVVKFRHTSPSTALRIHPGRHPDDGERPSYRWKTVSRLRGWGWTPVFTGVTIKRE